MKTLQTIRLKPNPSGKDRTRRGGATAAQLGGEWVDIQNMGSTAVDLTGVKLYHIAYSGAVDNGRWEEVMSFKGSLGAGQVIRVHAGNGSLSALHAVDKQGADYHLFIGRDAYVWNNDRGDCSALWQAGENDPFDKACYDANPPEGVILTRVGSKLVVATGSMATATSRR
jgi:hypothetical protein